MRVEQQVRTADAEGRPRVAPTPRAPARPSRGRPWAVGLSVLACAASLVAGFMVAQSDTVDPVGGQGIAQATAALPNTSGETTAATPVPAPAATTLAVPGTCPDPRAWPTQQLAQLLVVPGFNADGGWPAWLSPGVGGVFLPTGSGGLNAGTFKTGLPSTPQPFVSVDYEGGLVSDFANLLGPMPAPRDQVMTMSPEQVRALAAERAGAMQYYGINVDYAPVVDLDLGSPIVGNRSYGSDPGTVVTYAGAFSDGLRDNGVLPVLKHFPGHGSASGDSHKSLVVTEPWEVLKNRDVLVYKELLARPGPWMVMMGHLVVPGLSFDAETPSSVDPAAYRALRETTGFTGPIITDDLAAMKAITDRLTVPQAVVSAVSGGADMALISEASQYWDSVAALAAWADADPAKRQQLVDSALRSLTALPCGRP